MSCEICGRGSCTRTFHSIAEQEAFDSEAGAAERALFDKIADLELTCRAQTAAITALRAAIDNITAERDLFRRETVALAKDALAMNDALDHIGDCPSGFPHYCANCDRSFSGSPTALLSGRGRDTRMADWQPIETAPSHGYMLVYEDGAIRALLRMGGVFSHPGFAVLRDAYGSSIARADVGQFLPAGYSIGILDGCCENPTHWQPLPEPEPPSDGEQR